jgi:lysine-specific demethylase 6A
MRHTMQILDCVKSKGIEVKFHGRAKNEASHYCGVCEVIYSRLNNIHL